MTDVKTPARRAGLWVAGVDGCRGGWLVVLRRRDDPTTARAVFVQTFGDLLALEPSPEVLAVDMPIGLPDIVPKGGRTADVMARVNVGIRRSSVFAVPSRKAVMKSNYVEACNESLATSDPPRKVTLQCYYLFPKIREIDALMTPALQERVRETHPEVAFWALNEGQPLARAKKFKSPPHQSGLELRRKLLADVGYDTAFLDAGHTEFRASKVGADDFLDAAACSWTAARIATGQARSFPDAPPLDAKGLRMEIWG